jgi:hypothetical protein
MCWFLSRIKPGEDLPEKSYSVLKKLYDLTARKRLQPSFCCQISLLTGFRNLHLSNQQQLQNRAGPEVAPTTTEPLN